MADLGEADVDDAGEGYSFGDDVQSEIVSCLMLDSDFNRRAEGLIEASYFSDRLESVYAHLAVEHYRKYQEAPSLSVWKELVKHAFATKLVRDDGKKPFVEKLGQLARLEVKSRQWLLDSVAQYAKQMAMTNALMAAAAKLGKTSDDKRFEAIEKTMKAAFDVGLSTEEKDCDYFQDIEERTKERVDVAAGGKPPTGVTTGIKELDAALPMHGGFGMQELSIFLGGAKSGKSFALQFACACAVQAGHNCLFISLENSVAVVNARFDSFFSGVGLNEQFRNPHAIETAVKGAAGVSGVGVLKVRRAPAGTFRPADLVRILEAYKTKGLTFTAVYIDYLDICAPNFRYDNPIENSKSVYVDTRQIAVNWNVAMISASQVNRNGMKSAVVQATDVSDDINKIRTTDLAIGISRNESDRAEHKVRLTLAASRNSDDGITIFAATDFNRGRFISAVESVE